MSSTARGARRSPADNYPTPRFAVLRLLDGLCETLQGQFETDLLRWHEPAAGNAAIVNAVDSWRLARGYTVPIEWTLSDVRPECLHDLLSAISSVDGRKGSAEIRDALSGSAPRPGTFDVSITNPPFYLAEAFIERMRAGARHTLVLERLNFLGGPRCDEIRRSKPDFYLLPDRPEFVMSCKCKTCGNAWTLTIQSRRPKICPSCTSAAIQVSTTDSIEYAWFHWWDGASGRYTILRDTPAHERRIA